MRLISSSTPRRAQATARHLLRLVLQPRSLLLLYAVFDLIYEDNSYRLMSLQGGGDMAPRIDVLLDPLLLVGASLALRLSGRAGNAVAACLGGWLLYRSVERWATISQILVAPPPTLNDQKWSVLSDR